MWCNNEDEWVTIGDYQFAGHEGTLFVRYGRMYRNSDYNKWADNFKVKNIEIQRTSKYGHDLRIYAGSYEDDDIYVKCLSYYPVDWLGDLNDAWDYFNECGLYVKLSCSDFKKLLDFIGISGSTMIGDEEWGYDTTRFDRYKFIKQYGHFRRQVLERDGYQCACCGEDHELEVHHIYSFSKYLELGDDVSNGVTLCKKCHQKYHEIFGYNSNPIDFKDFIRVYGCDV